MAYNTQAIKSTLAKYKFFLGFENTIMPGYISEKLFKFLSTGIVVVYMGPVHDVPRITKSKSFVNVWDFPSVQELAKYLEYLDRNATAYEEYFAWRDEEDPWTGRKGICIIESVLCLLAHLDVSIFIFPTNAKILACFLTCTCH